MEYDAVYSTLKLEAVNYSGIVGFEVFTAVVMNSTNFWDMFLRNVG
jgi:hypothetical protein